MNSPKTPAPPDPKATADAQQAMNRQTAITQSQLGQVDQITPYGNLKYSQIGTFQDGTPRYQAETSFSPGEQALYDQYNQTQQKMGSIAGAQLDRVDSTLSSPLTLGNEATEARLMELGRKRLDPMLADKSAALEQQLLDRGIRPGSNAYAAKRDELGRQENDAYNQLLLTGRNQSINEQMTERNQPLIELNALLGNSTPTNPNFTTTPSPGVAPVDYTGLVNSNYQAQLQQAQLKADRQNAMLGAIAGAGGAAAGGWASGGLRRTA